MTCSSSRHCEPSLHLGGHGVAGESFVAELCSSDDIFVKVTLIKTNLKEALISNKHIPFNRQHYNDN